MAAKYLALFMHCAIYLTVPLSLNFFTLPLSSLRVSNSTCLVPSFPFSVCLSVHWSVCLYISLSTYLYISISLYLSPLSLYLSLSLSLYLCVFLSEYHFPSICSRYSLFFSSNREKVILFNSSRGYTGSGIRNQESGKLDWAQWPATLKMHSTECM